MMPNRRIIFCFGVGAAYTCCIFCIFARFKRRYKHTFSKLSNMYRWNHLKNLTYSDWLIYLVLLNFTSVKRSSIQSFCLLAYSIMAALSSTCHQYNILYIGLYASSGTDVCVCSVASTVLVSYCVLCYQLVWHWCKGDKTRWKYHTISGNPNPRQEGVKTMFILYDITKYLVYRYNNPTTAWHMDHFLTISSSIVHLLSPPFNSLRKANPEMTEPHNSVVILNSSRLPNIHVNL